MGLKKYRRNALPENRRRRGRYPPRRTGTCRRGGIAGEPDKIAAGDRKEADGTDLFNPNEPARCTIAVEAP